MASAMVVATATTRERGGEERGNREMLTAITQSSTAGSGETWRRRIDGGGRRSPRRKTMAMAAMEAVRRCVARRGGSRRRGGARGLLRCSRGARWLRLRRAVATGAFGRSGEREPGEGGGMRGWERGAGRRVASSGPSRATRGGQAGREGGGGAARRCARVGHAPSPCRGGRRQRRGGQVGWASCWAARCWASTGAGPQVDPGKVIPIYFFFYFSDICLV